MVANQEFNMENKPSIKEKLWTWNFFLLWQGQLVSAFGDIAYSIALGFWVYGKTGSTALMGTLMAVTSLPRLIISPFAGVWVDRSDRKQLIVWMDFIRGVMVVLVAAAAFMDLIQVWMVFVSGVILSICAAFFNPSVSSVVPDIVPSSKVIKANSALQMIYSGTNILGNPIGGVAYKMLGAPAMFLFNGISYIFSAFTEIFIKVPPIKKEVQQLHFFEDMKQGFKFTWKLSGLRNLIMLAAVLNFFGNTGMVLIMPFFQSTKGLGPEAYGIAIALMTGGSFAGMLVTMLANIKPKQRYIIFMASSLTSCIFFILFPLFDNLLLIGALMFMGGMLNAILNAIFGAVIQLAVPQNMRGKVFALMNTLVMGLTPIGMALGGFVAEFIPIKYVMSLCNAVSFFLFVPFIFLTSFKRFINYDPEVQTLEEIM